MVSIGLRVYSNSKIYYSIVQRIEANELVYHTISFLNIPMSLEKPERLYFIRNTLLDIYNEYRVVRAGIRLSEFTGHYTQTVIERNYLEGVIQESVASSPIEKYVAGQIATLTSVLGIAREEFKKYANAETIFPDIPEAVDWKELEFEERESILASNCGLNL